MPGSPVGGPESPSLLHATSIAAKTVTYDFHRLMDGATLVSCSDFAKTVIAKM